MTFMPWLVLAGLLAAALASFAYLGLDLSGLTSGEGQRRMLEFVRAFLPPETSSAFLARVWKGSGRLGLMARGPARLGLNLMRSIPELVWAVLMVLAAGVGPFAGTLALAVHTTGVLGRLFAETLENSPPGPTAALRDSGGSAVTAFLYGTLPVALPQFSSYTLYRWENNIRMATVLGFVGAGGLGQMLYVSLSLFKQSEAASVLIAMLVIVALVDLLSGWLRERLAG